MIINILDYLPEKTFVYVDDDIRGKLFGNSKRGEVAKLSRELCIKLKNMSRYHTGTRAMTKRIFFSLINKSKLNIKRFQDKIIIKVGRRGNKFKTGPFINITSDWVYISELIRGDGSLVKGYNNSYRTCFTNKDKVLINFVKDFFINIGIKKSNIGIYPNSRDPKIKNLVIHSETISYFLNSFFKIPFSHKGEMNIPKFIFDNKKFAINAVKGIFDAEGCINFRVWKGRLLKSIIIGMSDKTYLKDLQKILLKLNINSYLYKDKGRDMFRLNITDRESIICFYKNIRPLQSERSKKLKEMVHYYSKTKWASSKKIFPKILSLLDNKDKKRSEICDSLNLTSSQAGFFLTKLRYKKFIDIKNKIITNNGSWFIYRITDKGKDYLNEISTKRF